VQSVDDRRELEDRPLSGQSLPPEVVSAREAAARDDQANEQIVQVRAGAQRTVCRGALDQLEEWHAALAEQTDFDFLAFSRSSAIWLLAGRMLGLAESLWVLVDAGICNEAMVVGRSIHEAARVLPSLCDIDEEELVRVWLEDDGKYRYVKPKHARDAQSRYEQKLAEAMEAEGLKRLRDSTPLLEEMYDRLSRSAHNRRSACVDSVVESSRSMVYGRHPSAIRRGAYVEWAASVTVEVVLAVGTGLETFYGRGFAVEKAAPYVEAIEAIRAAQPLGEESVRQAAGTL
jgi:hypothetical protein